jgi:hypothetical protein
MIRDWSLRKRGAAFSASDQIRCVPGALAPVGLYSPGFTPRKRRRCGSPGHRACGPALR